MKKNILKYAFVIAVGSFVLASCGESSTEAHEEHEHTAEKGYYCPMKCEGDKIHAEPGSCSVCGMELVETEHYS